jgi:hypothetical protein
LARPARRVKPPAASTHPAPASSRQTASSNKTVLPEPVGADTASEWSPPQAAANTSLCMLLK